MFQFTTTTVINSNTDYTNPTVELWSKGTDAEGNPTLNIKRHLNFKKPNVVSITKAEYIAPQNAKATLDLSQLDNDNTKTNTYRIAMYIKLAQSSANSYYANDLVFKGKPLYIEFLWKKDEEAATVAKRVKEIVKKYMLAVYEKDLVKVTVEGEKVVITGIDEYQRFTRVDIELYVEDENPLPGKFQVVKSALPTTLEEIDGEPNPDYDENFVIEQGVEGFGTYQWILKNLRLPTAARTSWTAINADEAPIIGAEYNEYIIRYCVNRGIMGGDAVGEVTKSLTTHVFYVNKTVATAFEGALATIAPEGGNEEVPEGGNEEVPAED